MAAAGTEVGRHGPAVHATTPTRVISFALLVAVVTAILVTLAVTTAVQFARTSARQALAMPVGIVIHAEPGDYRVARETGTSRGNQGRIPAARLIGIRVRPGDFLQVVSQSGLAYVVVSDAAGRPQVRVALHGAPLKIEDTTSSLGSDEARQVDRLLRTLSVPRSAPAPVIPRSGDKPTVLHPIDGFEVSPRPRIVVSLPPDTTVVRLRYAGKVDSPDLVESKPIQRGSRVVELNWTDDPRWELQEQQSVVLGVTALVGERRVPVSGRSVTLSLLAATKQTTLRSCFAALPTTRDRFVQRGNAYLRAALYKQLGANGPALIELIRVAEATGEFVSPRADTLAKSVYREAKLGDNQFFELVHQFQDAK